MSKIIAFEGIDCAGKSTIVQHLVRKIDDCKIPLIRYREFCSPLGPLLKTLLSNGGTPLIKTYLFACDRAWSYEKAGLFDLENNDCMILWDRYIDSAIVYRTVELLNRQCSIDLDFVKAINSPFREADLTIYIDICAETAFERALNKIEDEPYSIGFLRKVRKEYLRLAKEKSYVVVDGESSLEEVIWQTEKAMKEKFEEFFV